MSKTIDGVPRELLERLQAQTELGNDWDEVQALLAAPVVERQDDALSKGFYTTQTGGGKYEINIGYRTIDELHAADEQLRDLLKSRTSQLTPVAGVLDERAEFEKALIASAERFHPNLTRMGPHPDAEYLISSVQDSWEVWQARASLDKVKELNQ